MATCFFIQPPRRRNQNKNQKNLKNKKNLKKNQNLNNQVTMVTNSLKNNFLLKN